MSIIRDNAGNPISEENPLPMKLVDIGFIMPTDEQVRYAQTIQTHNAVNVVASSGSNSAWIDTNGFNEIGITLNNDAATSTSVDVRWSNDGVNYHGYEQPITNASNQRRSGAVTTKARYVMIVINNNDTAAHTMSAWAYLKA